MVVRKGEARASAAPQDLLRDFSSKAKESIQKVYSLCKKRVASRQDRVFNKKMRPSSRGRPLIVSDLGVTTTLRQGHFEGCPSVPRHLFPERAKEGVQTCRQDMLLQELGKEIPSLGVSRRDLGVMTGFSLASKLTKLTKLTKLMQLMKLTLVFP